MGFQEIRLFDVTATEEMPNPEPTLLKPDPEMRPVIRVARINSRKVGE